MTPAEYIARAMSAEQAAKVRDYFATAGSSNRAMQERWRERDVDERNKVVDAADRVSEVVAAMDRPRGSLRLQFAALRLAELVGVVRWNGREWKLSADVRNIPPVLVYGEEP